MSDTITVLDFPTITEPNLDDYLYVIRGTGAGRDKKIRFSDLMSLPDTDESNQLLLRWDEDDSVNRALYFKVNASNRTVDLGGDLTLASSFTTTGIGITLTTGGTLAIEGATCAINQDLTTDATGVQFETLGVGTSPSTGAFQVQTSGSPIALFEDTSGNGAIYLRALAGNNTNLQFQEGAVTKGVIRWDGGAEEFQVIVNELATTTLYMPNSGSVGIGVTPTLGALHVSGKGYFTGQVECNDIDTGAIICTGINTTNGNITMGTGDLTCDDITASGTTQLDGSTTYTYAIDTRNSNIDMGTGDLTCDDIIAGNIDATDLTINDWIYHDGDTSTKIGFPSNGNIELHTDGSARLTVITASVTVNTGDLNVSAGDITISTGDLNVSAGNVDADGYVRGDQILIDGVISTVPTGVIGLTNFYVSAPSSPPAVQAVLEGKPTGFTGTHNFWWRIYFGGSPSTLGYIPVWT